VYCCGFSIYWARSGSSTKAATETQFELVQKFERPEKLLSGADMLADLSAKIPIS
jgi:hypothetical protein